jgi:hypothetical protein
MLWQLQIILNNPSNRRQNIPLLQHPNFSHTNDSCLVKLPRLLREFLCALPWWELKPFFFMSVRLFAYINTSLTGQVTVKLYIGAYENISKDLNLFKIGQKWGTLYENKVRFIVIDDINMHKTSVCNVSVINYVMLTEDVTYFSHMPECCAVHKLSILFSNGKALRS